MKLVLFKMRDGLYGVNRADISGVLRLPKMVRIPCGPEGVIGIVDLRREMVPVVDMGWVLGLGRSRVSRTKQLLVSAGKPKTAILVDRVLGDVRTPMPRVSSNVARRSGVKHELVCGEVRCSDQPVKLISLDAVGKRCLDASVKAGKECSAIETA